MMELRVVFSLMRTLKFPFSLKWVTPGRGLMVSLTMPSTFKTTLHPGDFPDAETVDLEENHGVALFFGEAIEGKVERFGIQQSFCRGPFGAQPF
jgi:hypothetical protein